ncbi:MAG: hypothetical protein KA446_06130 [Leptotrichiaceae bacterium]|mgnify:CR=1 FL=1|nr:hypothetical protein [Leptotrichiaceae bacterium]
MPIRLRIFSIFLIVFNFELFADEFINGTLVTEVNNNSYDELNETRYKTIDGDFTINLPKNNEMVLNIDSNTILNEDGVDLNKNKTITSFGGKYAYYGIKNFSIGVKGSLDYDHFVELNTNEFNFKKYRYDLNNNNVKDLSEYYTTYQDVGIKFFAEGVKKLDERSTLILMNELTFDKLESNLPLPHETVEPTLTITPKYIYSVPILKSSKFLTEIYLENRKYNDRTLNLEGVEKDFYSKFVATQHFIVDSELVKNLKIKLNSSVSYEQILGNENAQVLVKVSPRIYYSNNKFEAAIEGGEYQFEDEMGMDFDYYELFGYKIVGKPDWKNLKFKDFWKYEADAASIKSYIEYKLKNNYSIGQFYSYKTGEWDEFVSKTTSNNGYLKESVIKTYIKYQEDISKKLSFKLILDYSHTTYHHNLDLKMDNSSSVGITLGLKYNI